MARRKAPRGRRQGASGAPLGTEADQEPAGERAGPSRGQASRYEAGCSCPGRQGGLLARTWPNTVRVVRSSTGKPTAAWAPPAPRTATERCLPRGRVGPGRDGVRIGLCCRVGFPRRGTAAASLLALLPLQACQAKDGEGRRGDPWQQPPCAALSGRCLSSGKGLCSGCSCPPQLPRRGDAGQPAFVFFLPQEPLRGGGAGETLFDGTSQLRHSRACQVGRQGHRNCG